MTKLGVNQNVVACWVTENRDVLLVRICCSDKMTQCKSDMCFRWTKF